MFEADLAETYEAAHAKLALDCVATIREHCKLLEKGKIKELPAQSQRAAELSYIDTAVKHCTGITTVLESYAQSENPEKRRIYQLWKRQK